MAAAKIIHQQESLGNVKLLVDNERDEACKAYGSFPDRLYVVHEDRVAYQGGLGPMDYKVGDWL